MKKLSFMMLLLVGAVASAFAQSAKSPEATAEGKIGATNVKVVYFQPSARGRKIMGELVPYKEVWRTGANAATTIEFDKAVKIEGKDLPAGKYALFTIPDADQWVIIFNKDAKQFGAFNYKQGDDVLRVNVKPGKTPAFVETFNISVGKDEVQLKWENTAVAFKVKG